MNIRRWKLQDHYPDKRSELIINGSINDDDLYMTIEGDDWTIQSQSVDLDSQAAIEVATELFRRVGMADRLLECLIHEAVHVLKEHEN